MIEILIGVFGGLACGYLFGSFVQRMVKPDPDDGPDEPAFAWRGINLALGDGYEHEDANGDLAALRAAGWHIEKQGNERGGFVYLKLIPPGKKEQ